MEDTDNYQFDDDDDDDENNINQVMTGERTLDSADNYQDATSTGIRRRRWGQGNDEAGNNNNGNIYEYGEPARAHPSPTSDEDVPYAGDSISSMDEDDDQLPGEPVASFEQDEYPSDIGGGGSDGAPGLDNNNSHYNLGAGGKNGVGGAESIDDINAGLPGLPADFSMNIGQPLKKSVSISTEPHSYIPPSGSPAAFGSSPPAYVPPKNYVRAVDHPDNHQLSPPQSDQEQQHYVTSSYDMDDEPAQPPVKKEEPPRSRSPLFFRRGGRRRRQKKNNDDDDDGSRDDDLDVSDHRSRDRSPPKKISLGKFGSAVNKRLRPLARLARLSKGHKSDTDDADGPPIRKIALKKSNSFGSDGEGGDSLAGSGHSPFGGHGDYGSDVNQPPARSVTFDMNSADMLSMIDSTQNAGSSALYDYGDAPGGNFRSNAAVGNSGGDATMLSMLDPSRLAALGDITTGFVPPTHARGERARYSVYHGSGSRATKKRFRVRPYHCFDGPCQMTEEEIYADSLLSTKKFEHVKSFMASSQPKVSKTKVPSPVKQMFGSPEEDGRIGSLRMEVLGCISLPRTKPDVCCYVIVGDTAFCSDVIQGYRSPMWPSASRRGAIFPLHHAYARIYVGVFDVRARTNKDNDVFCGRVAIDVATLRPNTEYDITFPLRASTLIYDRRPRGVIRLRFSLHWFSERGAVMSYFRSPKSIAKRSPLVEGQPSIPCADPRTFRNVAITVHGQDFPGKYTRNAFRATMRELNLYRMNLIQILKISVKDAVLYQTPYISLYLFLSGMYCVYTSSIHLVPAIFMGYIIILYLENYKHYVAESAYNLGYRPLTIFEIIKGLLFMSQGIDGDSEYHFDPILVQKRTKKRRNKNLAASKLRQLESKDGDGPNAKGEVEIEPLDHREFPFSEREAYPKMSVEDALAPKKGGSRRGSTTALHGRLSVYYTATPPSMADQPEGDDDEDDSSEDDDDRDDETIMTESQMEGDSMFNLDMEPDDEDMDGEGGGKDKEAGSGFFDDNEAVTKSRVRAGPPQNNDVKGTKKIPPQVHLKKVEFILHKLSMGISVELVHPPPDFDRALQEAKEAESGKESNSIVAKKKKPAMDDYDRVLGLQSRSANPVQRIASSFLGPLMRMIRIFVYLVRVSFNTATWRDPYLSFWVLVALSTVCFILAVFPWRKFFLVVTIAMFGPQNLAIRKYLEKKKARKLAKEKEEEQKALEAAKKDDIYGYETVEPDLAAKQSDYGYGDATPDNARNSAKNESLSASQHSNPASLPAPKAESSASAGDGKLNFFQRKLAMSRTKRTQEGGAESSTIVEEVKMDENDRPAFRSELHGQSSSRKSQPRSVTIPYSRFRKERFYDWPPDPTVSRATPVAAVVGEPTMWGQDDRSIAGDGPPDMIIGNIGSIVGGANSQGRRAGRRRNPSRDYSLDGLSS